MKEREGQDKREEDGLIQVLSFRKGIEESSREGGREGGGAPAPSGPRLSQGGAGDTWDTPTNMSLRVPRAQAALSAG